MVNIMNNNCFKFLIFYLLIILTVGCAGGECTRRLGFPRAEFIESRQMTPVKVGIKDINFWLCSKVT